MQRVFILGCLIVGLSLSLSMVQAANAPKHETAAAAATKDDRPRSEGKKQDQAKADRKSINKRPMVVLLSVAGNYPEAAATPGMFGEMKSSLGALVRRLDAAAADKEVAAVWLKIDSLAIGRAKAFELRAAIDRLRKAGKPVYAELTARRPANTWWLGRATRSSCPPPECWSFRACGWK